MGCDSLLIIAFFRVRGYGTLWVRELHLEIFPHIITEQHVCIKMDVHTVYNTARTVFSLIVQYLKLVPNGIAP